MTKKLSQVIRLNIFRNQPILQFSPGIVVWSWENLLLAGPNVLECLAGLQKVCTLAPLICQNNFGETYYINIAWGKGGDQYQDLLAEDVDIVLWRSFSTLPIAKKLSIWQASHFICKAFIRTPLFFTFDIWHYNQGRIYKWAYGASAPELRGPPSRKIFLENSGKISNLNKKKKWGKN